MQFTDQDLRAAVTAGALDADRLNPLLDFLSTRATRSPVAPAPRFDLAHLLWYAGALIVMGAMGLFSTLAFSAMGGAALTATALVYAAAFTAAGALSLAPPQPARSRRPADRHRGVDGAARGLRHPGRDGPVGPVRPARHDA